MYALIGQSATVYCASKAYGNFKHHLNCYMQAIDHKFLWFRGMIALEEFINHLPTPCDLWIFSTNWGGYKSAEFGTNQIKRCFLGEGKSQLPRESLLEQRGEPTKATHTWCRVWEWNQRAILLGGKSSDPCTNLSVEGGHFLFWQ